MGTFKSVGDGRNESGLLAAGLLVDGNRPVLVLLGLAPHGAEVDVLQLLRELADLAVSDWTAVHLYDRRDLSPGAAQQELLAGVELRAVDASFDDGHTKLILD